MKGLRRSRSDSDYDYNYSKKKLKIEHPPLPLATIVYKSRLESLANETIHEIFDYLDVYHAYKGFFYLNGRFQKLVLHRNPHVQVNISTMSKSEFNLYRRDLIEPNKRRINYLRLSNPFTVDLLFSPPLVVHGYVQLGTLILDHIDAKYLLNIFNYLTILPKLHSLVLSLADYLWHPARLFTSIFQLPKLTSCRLTYRTKLDQPPSPIYLNEYPRSSIESFEINTRLSVASLPDLLLCLPKLRHLTIDSLVRCNESDTLHQPIALEYLTYVSIQIEDLSFVFFKEVIKSYFGSVETLRLTTNELTYLTTNQWQYLICSFMPHLRTFDFYLHALIQKEDLLALTVFHSFSSPFWSGRGWSFAHTSSDRGKAGTALAYYSLNPHRRTDYRLHSDAHQPLQLPVEEHPFRSVRHVSLDSRYVAPQHKLYFGNTRELTMEPNCRIFSGTYLNQFLPLKQLTQLTIRNSQFSFELIIQLLTFTPNVQVLKLHFLQLGKTSCQSIEQSVHFRQVAATNQVKHFEFRQPCSFEQFRMLLNFLPRLESLKTGMRRKEVHPMVRYLFSKVKNEANRLFFLCITSIPKVCLQEVKMLIRLENLVTQHSIKMLDRDLYLWW